MATNVVGMTALAWSADGGALVVGARSAEPATRATSASSSARSRRPRPTPLAEPRVEIRWQRLEPPADYVVEIGRLFDGVRGSYHRHVDLHVRSGRIAAIVGRGVLPAVGEIIDARDATVDSGPHRHPCALELACRRAARPRVARLRGHDGPRAHGDARRGRRTSRSVGERPARGAAAVDLGGGRRRKRPARPSRMPESRMVSRTA